MDTPSSKIGRFVNWMPPFPGVCLYYRVDPHVPAALHAFIEVVQGMAEDLQPYQKAHSKTPGRQGDRASKQIGA